jgi:hypothetical protein
MADAIDFGDGLSFEQHHALFAIMLVQRDRGPRPEGGDAVQKTRGPDLRADQRDGLCPPATIGSREFIRPQDHSLEGAVTHVRFSC